MPLTLHTPIRDLPGVGAKLEKRFHTLGIRRIQDLLAYYPKRYDDFRTVQMINQITPGTRVHIKAKVNLIENHRSPRRRLMITEALLSDETGSMKAIWFNQPFITRQLAQGDTAYFAGKADLDDYGFRLSSPTFEKEKPEQTHTGRIVPLYALTENLTAKQLRYAMKIVLPIARTIRDWLPEKIITKYALLPLAHAVIDIHFPSDAQALTAAQTRLKFNELFLIQLRAGLTRQQLNTEKAPHIPFVEDRTQRFVKHLPFTLTAPQKKSAWEILNDLHKDRPMNRLLEGDVGSGKTVVATLAMLNTAAAGYQSALMTPTEILAEQHFTTITTLLKDEKVSVALLTGSTALVSGIGSVSRKKLKTLLAEGAVDIVIGTHAIIQQSVGFAHLGLVIVDEQHRFGVQQRKRLSHTHDHPGAGDTSPHFLSMTATPIPRSLALTLYGDLDLSIIDTLPSGRIPIITRAVPPHERGEVYEAIKKEIAAGRQVFVICPLIDPSDTLGVKSVKEEAARLATDVFPDLRIGVLHGRLTAKKKEEVMREMASGSIDILCATAVVEVGIDVPNATVMLIEGAERFGLAQLHQFRGRVGRSTHQSYCFLLSDTESATSIDRLHALVESSNGFELAEKDLAFRGAGDLFGSRQTGVPQLRMATLADHQIIKQTRETVAHLLEEDPSLDTWPMVKKKAEQYERSLHLE